MNEQLQQALATILDKTINGIDASVGFMQAQLPDVIEQLLLWYAVKGAIFAVFGLLLIIPFILTAKKALSIDYKGATEDSFWVVHYNSFPNSINIGGVMALVFSGIGAFIGLAMVSNIITTMQIWLAPKIWLIEYAANLAK